MRLIFLVFLYQYSENAEYEIETPNISSNTRLFCEHPSSSQFFELKTELFFFSKLAWIDSRNSFRYTICHADIPRSLQRKLWWTTQVDSFIFPANNAQILMSSNHE